MSELYVPNHIISSGRFPIISRTLPIFNNDYDDELSYSESVTIHY